jgi:N4-gp56 family major capsid protein
MARDYSASANETVKLWSKKLWVEHRRSDAVYDPKTGFTGSDWRKNAFIEMDEAEKSVGDRIRSTMVFQLGDSPGTIGSEVLEGKEDSIESETCDLLIDQVRHGVQTGGRMNRQRVEFDTLEAAKGLLRDWWKNRRAVMAVNHLCGNARQTNLRFTGNNVTAEPDTDHVYRVGQGLGASNDETVGADNTALLDLDTIDELVGIAEQLVPPIAPFTIDGSPYYGMLIHGDVMSDLRKTSSQWYDVMKSALLGGQAKGNPLFTRASGLWRNTLIFVEPHIVQGTSSATGLAVNNTRRNVFFGAGALMMGYGRRQRGAEEQFYWHSGTWDHGDKYYASAACVCGVRATRFNVSGTPRDYAKIVVTSYSLLRRDPGAGKRDLHQVYA